MKRVSFVVVALTFAGSCFAEGTPSGKTVQSIRKSQERTFQPTPVQARTQTGPNGIGAIKIGMSKEAIESLSKQDGIYLTEAMKPVGWVSGKPSEGEEVLQAKLKTPFGESSVPANFVFEDSLLKRFSIFIDELPGAFEAIKTQISEKYGSGQVRDNREEKQCIYKNGANFKLVNGYIVTSWIDKVSSNVNIETKLTDDLTNTCPVDLRLGEGMKLKTQIFSVGRSVKSVDGDKGSIF